MDNEVRDELQSLNATLQSFDGTLRSFNTTLKQLEQTLDRLNGTWRCEQDRQNEERYGVHYSF